MPYVTSTWFAHLDKLDAEVTAILQQNTQLPSGSRFTEAQGGPVKFVMSDFYGKRPSLTSTTTSSPKSTDQQWDRVNRLSGVSDKTESSAPSVSPFDFHRKCSVMSLGGIPVLNQGEKPVNVVAQNSHTVPSDIINESRWTGPTIERPADLKPPTNGKETSSRDEPVHLGMLEEPNMTEIPRLTTSGSVANFMNRINRIRFHSHCVPGTIGADETHHQMDTSSDDSDASETEEQPSTVNLNASGLGMDEDVVNKKKISDTTAERKWSKRGLFRPRASSCPPSKMKRSATREKFRKISMEPRGLKPKVQRNSLQTAQDPLFLHGVVDVLNQMTASGPAEAGVIMSPSSSK